MGKTETAAIPKSSAAGPVQPGREERERAAIELIASGGAELRDIARRYSLCADDADDAYQRALEILLLRAPTTDADALASWMQTVTKREALGVRRSREQLLSGRAAGHGIAPAPVEHAPSHAAGPADWTLRREHLAHSNEALQALKPDEMRSLMLCAEGYTYAEIAEVTGWSSTKVRRCIAEGRRRFVETYASIEAGRRCQELLKDLSAFCDGELGGERAELVRRHLSSCGFCQATAREYRGVPERVLGLLPAALPAARPPGGACTSGSPAPTRSCSGRPTRPARRASSRRAAAAAEPAWRSPPRCSPSARAPPGPAPPASSPASCPRPCAITCRSSARTPPTGPRRSPASPATGAGPSAQAARRRWSRCRRRGELDVGVDATADADPAGVRATGFPGQRRPFVGRRLGRRWWRLRWRRESAADGWLGRVWAVILKTRHENETGGIHVRSSGRFLSMAVVLALPLLTAASAQAGIYQVQECAAGFPNAPDALFTRTDALRRRQAHLRRRQQQLHRCHGAQGQGRRLGRLAPDARRPAPGCSAAASAPRSTRAPASAAASSASRAAARPSLRATAAVTPGPPSEPSRSSAVSLPLLPDESCAATASAPAAPAAATSASATCC